MHLFKTQAGAERPVIFVRALRAACIIFAVAFLAGQALAELEVTSDFEGGSGVVDAIDQATNTIRLAPTTHPKRGWDCWWYVKVTGITPGQTVAIDLGGGRGTWGMPQFASYSTDGKTWRHIDEPGERKGKRIIYRQKIDGEQAWFAWGPPFVPSDAAALVERIARESPHATAFELCKTREGRPIPALHVHEDSEQPNNKTTRYGVWINARQHAWESGSSWVCRGLTEWLVSDDPRALTLRRAADIYIVPIMDVDNTARGAGGKQQQPHDHNRDWSDKPHWPAVAAATRKIKQLDEAGRFDVYLDLHNPGPNDRQPFYYVAPANLLSENGRANLKRFVEAAAQEMKGPLPLSPRTRESGPGYDKMWRSISKNWVVFNTSDHVVAVTLETSWNTPHSDPRGYMAVGRQQGLALEKYFRQSPRN